MRLAALALTLLAAPALATPNFTTKDFGVRVSSAVMQAEVPTGGSAYPARFYYIRGSSQVVSATTSDGLAFTDDTGVRLSSLTVPSIDIAVSSITGLSVLPLNGGGFRMLYSVIGTTGAFRVYSATSADGLSWANDTGTAVDPGGLTFAQDPSLVDLGSGDWQLYLIENSIAGNQVQNHEIFVATSTNYGRNWTTPVPAFAVQAGEVSAVRRTDGRVRLYYSAPPSVGVSTNTQLLSALSTLSGGTAFAAEAGVRLSTGSAEGAIDFPLVVRSTDNFRWRVYYDFAPFQKIMPSTADVYSAVTDVPDVQSISPNSVIRTLTSVATTITGEVFSPTGVTAELTFAGQSPITGSVTVVNDQTLDVTFPVLNQAIGNWNVVVADSNGQQDSLDGAFEITFPGGNVNMLDNLIRPREGTETKIQVTTFDDGNVTVKIYTIDGRPVSTLFDGFQASGTHTYLWNGTTALGHVVASGVYIARVEGPKLNAVNKIVVIK